MPNIGGLQLLPETRKKIDVSVPGQNKLLVLSFIFLAIVLGGYFALLEYNKSLLTSLASLDEQFAELDKSRDKQLESRLFDLNQQLAVVNPLISSHIFWSRAFTKIQSLVEPQLQFKSLSTDAFGNKISIVAIAANYTTIAKQIASFYTFDSLTDVILSKVQSQPTGQVELNMQLVFDPGKLLSK